MLNPNIEKIAVVGGGTMGSGIAAHFANLGFSVSLLSLTREEAIAGLERARHGSPPGFMTQHAFQSVKTGDIESNPELIAEADWVCEAIVERLGPKRALYQQLEQLAQKASYITTNTSGLPLVDLAAGLPDEFQRKFFGTHFFNPVRYLKLLELIPGPASDPALIQSMSKFLETEAGKRVVVAKDTPGFIANRFGMFALFQAIHLAEQLQFSSEQVDAVTGTFLGRPKSGTFRLADIIGLDVMKDIADNLRERCPDEATQLILSMPASTQRLLDRGWIGEKAGQGYFRREAKDVFTLDLTTTAYRLRQEPDWESLKTLGKMDLVTRIRHALGSRDEVGEFTRGHLRPILRYAESIRNEISHTTRDFDRVMEWGFGWEMGPFRLAHELGPQLFDLPDKKYYLGSEDGRWQTLTETGSHIEIVRDPAYARLTDFPIVESFETISVRNLAPGVLGLCLTTRNGVIGPQVVADLTEALNSEPHAGFVLTTEGKNFSFGYDLKFLLDRIEAKAFEEIDAELAKLHRLGELLEHRRVVAAVFGYTLGAGLELAQSCSVILADAEAKIGLPETRVGLIPGGRGTVLSRLHSSATAKEASEAANTLLFGVVAKSAAEAKEIGHLRPTDLISFHPDRLLSSAIRLAKDVPVRPRAAWIKPEGPLTGMIDRLFSEAQKSPDWSPYDATIAEKIKNVFSKSVGYEDALLRERSEFIDLCSKSMTQARIRHMVETGKPLRN